MNNVKASPRLIVNSFFYSHRAIWTATELMSVKEARSWFVSIKKAHVVQSHVHGDRAHSWATRDEANSWLIVNSYFRAMCTATDLMKKDEADEGRDEASLWFMIDCELILEPCARGERAHVNTEPCARRRSSWLTLKHARHRLWTYIIWAMCTRRQSFC